MKAHHFNEQVGDYVLGLLSPEDRLALETHAAVCADCRAALRDERQMTGMLRDTFGAIAQPSAQRLARMMPAYPVARRTYPVYATWQRAFAIVAVLLFLFVANMGYQQLNHSITVASPQPTTLALTATATIGPTATATEVAILPTDDTIEHSDNVLPVIPLNITPVVTTMHSH